jgi:hypothetical protein
MQIPTLVPLETIARMRRTGPNLEASEVLELLHDEMGTLPRAHRSALQRALILARKVPVADSPSEHVVAVASFGDKLLYWSDLEGGWELETLDERGRISTRGGNQFDLGQALWQELGAPRRHVA